MKKRFFSIIGLVVCLAISFVLSEVTAESDLKIKHKDFLADLVILNGNIITVDDENPRAEALAVYGDKIAAVGETHEIQKLIGNHTLVINAQGKTVTPGFIDAHMHPTPIFPDIAHRMHVVNLFDITSMEDLIAGLKAKADLTPPGQWVQGSRYQDTKIGRHPTREDLDKASTEHLITISHSSGHITVVNSLVLEMAGIDKNTPDPPGGAFDRYYGHPIYEDGTPNGICMEGAGSLARSMTGVPLPVATEEEYQEGLALTFQNFLEKGITSIGDASTTADKVKRYQKLIGDGTIPLRVNMMVRNITDPLISAGLMTGFGNNRLQIGPLKLIAGNSLSGRTCLLYEPYVGSHAGDDPPYYGIPHALILDRLEPGFEQPGVLEETILPGHKAGFQWAIHMNGDRENDFMLDAYKWALEQFPRENHRHRIEHATVVNMDILKRAKELGVILNFHPYIWEHGDKFEDYGEERIKFMIAYRSALDLGVRVAAHSDWSVSQADPLLHIHSMVTRLGKDGVVYGPEQAISPEEALRVWTMDNAYASFEEDIKGSLEVGKLADIVILSADPTKVDPFTIKDIEVKMTIIGGNIEYQR